MIAPSGPLSGLRILDLTRIMAGPTCTQILGDLGADVIKIERPGAGDDTRKWGPPYFKDRQGRDTDESAYYLSVNRNKRSLTIDISQAAGQDLIRRLLGRCDVLVENFKVGGLARYGLSYDQLKGDFPTLVYCSITGFGQTGPYAPRPGYDFLAQGIGGIMSITGERDGEPMKVGVGISDVVCGMYAGLAIVSAIRHRDLAGEGQWIDVALLDSQVAWLINEGLNYLTSGVTPPRRGNAHPNIVPYQLFEARDGHVILAVGNDAQFQRFCDFAGVAELAADERFITNAARVRNRDAVIDLLAPVLRRHTMSHWLDGLEARGVPCGPVNDIAAVFEDPQVKARGMKITMPHPAGEVDLIASPVKMSATPVTYRRPPPTLGQHTDEILAELLGLNEAERAQLRESEVI
jgi:crotonobetainyl-CoA:carnitine CoA-transferase CaiB-like acyl-CoA transferase